MKLLLTSTGLPSSYRDFFLTQLNIPPSTQKVAFIPTAADPDDDKWYIDASIKELIDLKFPVDIVDLKIDKDLIKQKLIASQIIYIDGGNTFYLLEWIRKSGLDTYLKGLLQEGRIYIGSSAGALVACPDISAAGWSIHGDKNINKLSDLSGLSLVDFVVYPHYSDEELDIITTKSKTTNYPIITISNTQAVWWVDGKWQIIGQ